jgi:hypothetical protein
MKRPTKSNKGRSFIFFSRACFTEKPIAGVYGKGSATTKGETALPKALSVVLMLWFNHLKDRMLKKLGS